MKNKFKESLIFYKQKLPMKLVLSYTIFTKLNNFIENLDKVLKKDDSLITRENILIYDPITMLISNFEEIQNILDLKEENLCKFLYFNRNNVHYILNENEQRINIDCVRSKKNLSFYFYLYLLTTYTENEIIFSYSIDLINEINELQSTNNDKIYKNILIAKIIIQLIHNYKENDDIKIEKKVEDILYNIEEKNNSIIKEDLIAFSKIGINMKEDEIYKEKNIDEIYIEIIVGLIKSNKFDNYEEIYNIIEELDLENIIITKKMFNTLSEALDPKKGYINSYLIKDIEDLYNEKIINFYYILLKYIINNSIYIYNIPLLLQVRNKIIKIIKEIKYDDIKEDLKNKLNYIIEKITDLKYYFNQIIKEKNISIIPLKKDNNPVIIVPNENNSAKEKTVNNGSKEISMNNPLENQSLNKLKEQKDFSNNVFINSSQDLSLNGKDVVIGQILTFSDEKEKFEDKLKNFEYIIISQNQTNSESKNKDYLELKNKIKEYKRDEIPKEGNNIIVYDSFMKLIKFVDETEKKIKNFIEAINGKNNRTFFDEIKLVFTEINENGRGDLKNIKCECIINNLNSQITDKNFEVKDILNNLNTNEDIIHFLSENKNILGNNSLSSIKKTSEYSSNQSVKSTRNKLDKNQKQNNQIEIEEIEYLRNNRVNYIEALSQNLIIIGGDKKIIFCDSAYKQVHDISIKNDNISKIEGIKKNNYMEFIICSDKETNINLLTIPNNINNLNDYRIRKVRDKKTRICFQFNKDFILCDENGLFQINDLTSNITPSEDIRIPNINESYWTGIKINSELIALTSNKHLTNGEDAIIFYNYYGKRIVKTIENYSFTLSQNNLALMPKEGIKPSKKIEKSNKILLCACRKYEADQKNGILLLKLEMNDNFKILSQNFYETGKFEVYCFCPISLFYNINDISILNKENNQMIETEYFLVGGFYPETKQGLIKLYKVIYNREIFEKTEIEYFSDFEIEKDVNIKEVKKFDGFKGYITCITQSRYDGAIFVGCSDGKVYSLLMTADYFFHFVQKN